MNSAMMPQPGLYAMQRISRDEFYAMLQEALSQDPQRVANYIGYPQNLELITEATGFRLQVSREVTRVQTGDQMLVMKLSYRMDPSQKGRPVDSQDFEFFLVQVLEAD